MIGCWTPAEAPADPAWKLSPRWLELEQDGFLLLDDSAALSLEEAE